MFNVPKTALVLVLALAAGATTLQQLGLDDMIQQSSGIVRGKVTGISTSVRGQDIYTHYRIQIIESWKGAASSQLDVAIPGGTYGTRQRQVVAGAPELANGQEYVIFYWTSKSGLTQVIGLSQGLFSELQDGTGNPLLTRPAASATMLDKNGNPTLDQPVSMRLSDLKARVASVLQKAAAK
jgi:hypothetical protein